MDTLVEIAEDYGYTRADVEAMMPDIDLASYAVSAGSYLANIVTQASSPGIYTHDQTVFTDSVAIHVR
jgi:hypothetical protein